MKTRVFLCLSAILLTIGLHAQDLTILVNKKGKVGFADKSGAEVIKCEYESVQPFSDGIAIVTKSGKQGFIDASGTVLLPLKYTQISLWNNGIYLIKDGKKMGLADRQGKIVLPAVYSHISKLNCYGKALIALGGKATPNEKKTYMANAKYGIVDAQGNVLITPKYRGLYEFSYNGNNLAPYNEGQRLLYSYHHTVDTLVTDCSYMGFSNNGYNIYECGIMDSNGKEILKAGLYSIVMKPKDGMIRYYIHKKSQMICGYHDPSTSKGFAVSTINMAPEKVNIWSHGDFTGSMAPVNIGGKSWSFVDKTGKTLRTGYSAIKRGATKGLWAAKKADGTWETFSDSNDDIAELSSFGDINFPMNEGDKEIYSVMKDGKYGCINSSGKVVIPYIYEMALGNNYDMVMVKKDGKWGLMSADNTCIIPTEYIDMILPTERNAKHHWVKKADSLYYHLNLTTKRLSAKGYKVVTNFENGIAFVVPPGMKVDNTQVNRAQVYAPNTDKATLDALELSKYIGSFGYILNSDDILLMDSPVSTLYKDAVLKEIGERKGRALTKTEKKNIMLKVTRENRSYDLNSTLGEEEWNF